MECGYDILKFFNVFFVCRREMQFLVYEVVLLENVVFVIE